MATHSRVQTVLRIAVPLLLLGGILFPITRIWSSHKTSQLAITCRQAIDEGRWDEAHPLAEQWARRAPQDAQAWLSLAEIAKHKGDLSATAECLGRIAPTDENYLSSQMLRGDLLLDGLKRPDLAINVWKDMLKVSPHANVANQRLLYVYSMTLQREPMVKQIHEAILHHAEPPEAYGYLLAAPNLLFTDGYLKVGQWLQANPQDETLRVAQAIFAARSSPSKGMKMFGAAAVAAGDTSGVTECLKDYPNNIELRAFLIEKAIADADIAALGKGLQHLPPAAETDSRFWRYIAAFRDSQRRHAEAAEALYRSIELHPLDWKSHHELGNVERTLGHAEAAARHAELGARGKQLEREIMELPNAAEADVVLLTRLLEFARDCGEKEMVNGLSYRLKIEADASR